MNFHLDIHVDTIRMKFDGQGYKPQEENELSNCWNGRPRLKGRPEVETVNK